MLNVSEYDFIDFGASKGGSLDFASANFGGRGIGIDIDPKKIESLRSNGHEGIVADATSLSLPDGSLEYATMMNFLEHLPNASFAQEVIHQAVRVSRKFVYIMGPNFDDIEYLASLGLKKFYADWSGHTWHHTKIDFQRILSSLGVRYHIIETERIRRSSHKYLLPINTVSNQNYYDADIHPPKNDFRLKSPVFGWITVIIEIGDCNPLDIFARSLRLRSTAGNI